VVSVLNPGLLTPIASLGNVSGRSEMTTRVVKPYRATSPLGYLL
jgi:hypothetical protein